MGDALHEGEAVVDEGVVRALLRAQAPDLADLPVVPLRATGTVNRVFRLGDALAVRLPRLAAGGEDVRREARVVPLLAGALPVDVPEPVLLGEPVDGVLAAAWSIVHWVDWRRRRGTARRCRSTPICCRPTTWCGTGGWPGCSPGGRPERAIP